MHFPNAGDPVRLFHHLGLGVWSFLASPAAGLMDTARGRAPQRLAAGVALGLRGLVSNTVYGFSNATAKMSGAARKVGRGRTAFSILAGSAILAFMTITSVRERK